MAQFEIWINNTPVDIRENIPMSITNSIADIMKPDTRQSAFTKTISIPATKSNRELFDYIFELSGYIDSSGNVNYDPDFNPNLKTSAVILVDSVEVFNGIAQLTSIQILDNDNIDFEIVLTGQLMNLFKNIGDGELSDLDFSEFDHDFTRDNIEASWLNTFEDGYVYPLIDYGYSTNLINFSTNQLRPAIFAKKIIDKIFSDAGCTYDSAFFDSSFFENLIIPFTGSNFKITTTDAVNRKFRASRETSDQQVTVNGINASTAIIFNDDSTAPNFDNSTQFDITNGRFTVGTGLTGVFNFGAYVNVTARWIPDTPAIDMRTLKGIVASVSFIKRDINGNDIILNTVQRKINSGNAYDVNTDTESDPNDPANYLSNIDGGNIYFTSGSVYLQPTEYVRVVCTYFYSNYTVNGGSQTISTYGDNEKFIDASNNIYDGDYYLRFNIGSYFYNEIANADYQEGQLINMNSVLPEKVKQKDLLMSIIKMFNLYLEQDKDVTNNFIIEPRDDGYYYDGSLDSHIIDLTNKIDDNKDLQIEPMGALDFKQYYFKYKEDKDYFNNQYLLKWGETYSERLVEVNNDFLVDKKTTDVIFSATPSVGSNSNDRVIPRILNIDLNGSSSPVSANPRILIWGGLKDTNQAWAINFGGVDEYYTQYPYAGMLDDPYNPTVSLDWEVPDEIYWTNAFETITYTNKNLFNQYWKKFINEVTDRNSKIVTGWFNIRPYDYSILDFRKLYYFKNEYFRLNKIFDYNPLSNALTKMQFIKIQRSPDIDYDTTQLNNLPELDISPAFSSPDTWGLNITAQGFTRNVMGERNRIPESTRSYSVTGNDNIIGERSHGIFITGDSNSIAGDSSGVIVTGGGNYISGSNITLINTFNKIIDQNNCTYINGVIVSGTGMIEYINSNKTRITTGNDAASIYLIDCTTGNINFNLPSAADIGICPPITFKKIDSSGNTVTIIADGSETIDGAANYILNTQWQTVTIFSDSQNWYVLNTN